MKTSDEGALRTRLGAALDQLDTRPLVLDAVVRQGKAVMIRRRVLAAAAIAAAAALTVPTLTRSLSLPGPSAPTKYRVIVNDQPTDLPVITADGKPNAGSATLHFAAVDDAAFPLVVVWEWSGQSDSSRIVKITYPVENKIEKELKDQGRAEIYGIYFDFDSDQIRSESEPVLAEIAEILKKQPEWKLNVEGHTDNVGGDKHNLDLSERRAASVINALVTRYQVEGARLAPTGYGAARPKASNDTVEGRALNRRVELVRK